MITHLTNIACLALIIVFIVDISGWTETWKGWLRSWLKVSIGRVKPFDCSLCTTWWAGFIYLIIVGKFTLPWLAVVAAAAMLTPVIQDVIRLTIDILQTIINIFVKLCNKIN